MNKKVLAALLYLLFLYSFFTLAHAGLEEVYGDQPAVLRLNRGDGQIEILGRKFQYPFVDTHVFD
ncbi:hypothetical protein PRVXH_001132 [Proteinivorax hydrogeniformans]|uniref:Uncharacterized protein n=1 Tax=Proteinivorax hydrogeniformans TaxID=1826727 RepID=A0AAU8HWR0_9FIRM